MECPESKINLLMPMDIIKKICLFFYRPLGLQGKDNRIQKGKK